MDVRQGSKYVYAETLHLPNIRISLVTSHNDARFGLISASSNMRSISLNGSNDSKFDDPICQRHFIC